MATDSFLQTSGGPQALNVYSANWQQVQGTFNIPNGTGDVRCTASGVDHLARYTAFTPGASQYAEIVPATGWAASGRYIGPAVRVSASGDAYSVQATGGDWVVGRMVGGAWTNIGSGSWIAVDGQPIRLEVTGVGATVTLVLKRNGTTVTTINDTNAARITAANSLGFGGYDAAGSDPGIADWTGDNLGGGTSDLSGSATLDGLTAGGGIQGGSDLSGNADLGGMSAGGTLATNPPTDLSGGGTLDSVSASGTLAQSPATSLSGGATLDGVTAASGNLGQAGTVTSQPLKRNNGTLVVSQALTWVGFRNATTGTDVVVRTGISTNALGVFSVSDGLLQPGTTYAVQWRESSGHHGEAHAVAV